MDSETVTCPQEEHDACSCAEPKVVEKGGMFVYTPYIFEVSEEWLKASGFDLRK